MATVRFGVLGPLEASNGAGPLQVTAPKRRALLALLLLNVNRVVSINRAIDALWGEAPPASARTQVQSLVHALRRHLAAVAESGPSIETRPEGYVLTAGPDAVDLSVFECLASAARDAAGAGRLEEAATDFRAALELWRGPALDGVDAPFVGPEAARLEEQRLLATEERIEVDLALGHHAELVAELVTLVAEHPFRERLQAALMLALHRCGRRPEALEVYQGARRAMVEDFGLDPGRGLQELERAILRDERSLAPEPRPGPGAAAGGDPPDGGRAPLPEPAPAPRPAPVAGARRRGRHRTAAVALLAVATVAVVSVGSALVPPRPAPAAASRACAVRAMAITDFHGRVFDHVYHCSTIADQTVNANPQDQAPLEEVSLMFGAADVWVICQVRGRANPVVRGRENHWWLYTQGDTTSRSNRYGYTNAWGFLPASAVLQAAPEQAVPGVPVCPTRYIVPGPPAVSSPDYPADGLAHGGHGGAGMFVLAPVPGTTDLAGFMFELDSASPEQFVASTGTATIRIEPPGAGPHVLSVWAKRRSGSLSSVVRHEFVAG